MNENTMRAADLICKWDREHKEERRVVFHHLEGCGLLTVLMGTLLLLAVSWFSSAGVWFSVRWIVIPETVAWVLSFVVLFSGYLMIMAISLAEMARNVFSRCGYANVVFVAENRRREWMRGCLAPIDSEALSMERDVLEAGLGRPCYAAPNHTHGCAVRSAARIGRQRRRFGWAWRARQAAQI